MTKQWGHGYKTGKREGDLLAGLLAVASLAVGAAGFWLWDQLFGKGKK